jgi:Peptidase family M48
MSEAVFQADYFDGKHARQNPVWVSVSAASQYISFEVDGQLVQFPLADVVVQAKLGKAKRMIDLPNGGHLQALDIRALEQAMPARHHLFWHALHYVENHMGLVVLAFLLTVGTGWLFFQYAVPLLAERVAKATPIGIEKNLGQQVLSGLDHQAGYFSQSKTPKTRQAEITKALQRLCDASKDCPPYQLLFRDGGRIGANAFAIPGGYMLLTDQMIALSEVNGKKNDDELLAVMAHELGHVKERHAFRQSIQGIVSGLILASITGDVSTVAAGLPTALLQMRYSRGFELEADAFALNALQKACIPPKVFADILQRMQRLQPAKNEDAASQLVKSMLASHPDAETRIKPFLAAKPACVK